MTALLTKFLFPAKESYSRPKQWLVAMRYEEEWEEEEEWWEEEEEWEEEW